MTSERKRALELKYQNDIRGVSQDEATHHWNKYLKILHDERDERDKTSFYIFLAVRKKSRDNGYRADMDLILGNIDKNLYRQRLKKYCIDVYAKSLARYGLTNIDIDSTEWIKITNKITGECIKAFRGIDPDDNDAVCTAMAKTWHRFIQLVHREYNLPTVKSMRKHIGEDSAIEIGIVDADEFETL